MSPANKDRPESRDGFAAKCLAYLQRGVGLIVVDVVTERTPNLHNEMVRRQGLGEKFQLADDFLLYAAAYRPLHRDGRNETEVWAAPLAVGQQLPTLPLALRGGPCVPLDLEATYTAARGQSRL